MPAAPIREANVGAILRDADDARLRGEIPKAIESYADALAIDPSNTYARYWIATCCEEGGQLELARQHCDAGLEVEPGQIALLLRKGSIAVAASDHHLALECYLAAAALDPDIPPIDALIADRYCFLGEIRRGVEYFDRALQKEPDSTLLQSNKLFVLNYDNLVSAEELFAMHARWGDRHELAVRTERVPHRNSKVVDRVLRVGYVSGDLRNHAVSFFVEPLLRHHDRSSFIIHCYDTSTVAEDATTARLKDLGHAWRRVGSLSDSELADLIRADEIDILIDLSGHTVMNRLLVFARKPAPVQATWLGYLGTTGLSTMDFRITDAYLDPPGMTERFHTEQLLHLPNFACFAPPTEAPPVERVEGSAQSTVTFGSINQWSKVNAAVVQTWASILRATRDSELIVVAPGARNPAWAAAITDKFVREGVERYRIVLQPTTSLADFLSMLARVDLVLDPFPYGGGTTTMHALWMGVPVVTLAGTCAFARNSIGALTELGLERFIAQSREQYVAIAADYATRPAATRLVRPWLRQRMSESPLLDQPSFTLKMEHAFREMWRRYCLAR